MNLLSVIMKDGSVFKMPNESWQRAFNLESDNPSATIKTFKEITHKYWLKSPKPRKPWGGKYKNEAEFGKEIMYDYIGHSLNAIELHKRTIEEERNSAPEVIVSGDGGLTVYTGVGKKKYDSIDVYLAEKKRPNNRHRSTVDEKIKLLIKERIRKKAKKLFIADARAGRLGPLLSKTPTSDENLKALGYWKRAEEELKSTNLSMIINKCCHY